MKSKLILCAALAGSLGIAGCADMSASQQSTLSGAGIGTAAGVAVGAITGDWAWAAAGAAIGAGAGYLTEQERAPPAGGAAGGLQRRRGGRQGAVEVASLQPASQAGGAIPSGLFLRLGQVAHDSFSPCGPNTSGPPQEPRRQGRLKITPTAIASTASPSATSVSRNTGHSDIARA